MAGLLFDRQRTAAADLVNLIEERRRDETACRSRYDLAEEDTCNKGNETLQRLARQCEQELADLDAAFEREQEELSSVYAADRQAEEKSYQEGVRRIEFEQREARQKLEREMQDVLWAADSLLEAGQKRVQQKKSKLEHEIELSRQRAETLW